VSRRKRGSDDPPRALRHALARADIVRAVLRFVGVPERDIEDCTQEVILRAWRAAQDGRLHYEHPAAVRAWLRVVSTRFGSAWAEGRRRTLFLDDTSEASEPAHEPTDAPMITLDLLREMRDATTPERWRAWLALAEGSTLAEIAAAEGIAVGTAATRVMFARRDFAAAIRRERAREQGPAVRRRRRR
jgi:DNA-directed RNA polymerase specialized sigma24 family protein